jgi:hypothetical protein
VSTRPNKKLFFYFTIISPLQLPPIGFLRPLLETTPPKAHRNMVSYFNLEAIFNLNFNVKVRVLRWPVAVGKWAMRSSVPVHHVYNP